MMITYIAVTGQARNIKPTTMKDAVTQIEQTSVTMHGVTPLRLARTIYGVGGNILYTVLFDESRFLNQGKLCHHRNRVILCPRDS